VTAAIICSRNEQEGDMIKCFRGRKALKTAGIDRDYSRLRYKTFIQEQQWPLSHRNGEEWDIYDTDDAVYIMAFDAHQKIMGGARMLPTTQAFLMEDVFGHLVDTSGVLPKGPAIMEFTRYFIRSDIVRSRQLIQSVGQILCAVMEWSLDEGLESMLLVVDMSLLPQLYEMGWKVRPLGLPGAFGGGTDAVGGGMAAAVCVEISDAALMSTAALRHVQLPVLGIAGRLPAEPTTSIH
jgi:acyl-homoserine lactone synthase